MLVNEGIATVSGMAARPGVEFAEIGAWTIEKFVLLVIVCARRSGPVDASCGRRGGSWLTFKSVASATGFTSA